MTVSTTVRLAPLVSQGIGYLPQAETTFKPCQATGGVFYVQDERYIAIEHMDVRRDCFSFALRFVISLAAKALCVFRQQWFLLKLQSQARISPPNPPPTSPWVSNIPPTPLRQTLSRADSYTSS